MVRGFLLLPIVRLHPPMELVAQGAVIAVAGDLHQLERHRSAAHGDAVTARQRDGALTVELRLGHIARWSIQRVPWTRVPSIGGMNMGGDQHTALVPLE